MWSMGLHIAKQIFAELLSGRGLSNVPEQKEILRHILHCDVAPRQHEQRLPMTTKCSIHSTVVSFIDWRQTYCTDYEVTLGPGIPGN